MPSIERLRFHSSGTEATLMAMRLARAFTGKDKVIKLQDHFHGWHDYAMAGSDRPAPGVPEAAWGSMVIVPPGDLGAVEDVLDRFYQAARRHQARTIVRITADDPFKDPYLLEAMLWFWLDTYPAWDYLSNTLEPTYPEGLDLEIFSWEALETAWKEAVRPSDREHVTPYIWRHPHRFRLYAWKGERDLSAWRWTVDYPEDLRFARAVYERLYPRNPLFGMEEILHLLETDPKVRALAPHAPRNEGYWRSLREEEADAARD